MSRPKKVTETNVIVNKDSILTDSKEGLYPSLERNAFVYPVPETREDYLNLHQLLKDIGCNSIGDVEVRASKL